MTAPKKNNDITGIKVKLARFTGGLVVAAAVLALVSGLLFYILSGLNGTARGAETMAMEAHKTALEANARAEITQKQIEMLAKTVDSLKDSVDNMNELLTAIAAKNIMENNKDLKSK